RRPREPASTPIGLGSRLGAQQSRLDARAPAPARATTKGPRVRGADPRLPARARRARVHADADRPLQPLLRHGAAHGRVQGDAARHRHAREGRQGQGAVGAEGGVQAEGRRL
ncbi:hypothetical protein LTR16_010595, partial [Cryomyces antarcticus]